MSNAVQDTACLCFNASPAVHCGLKYQHCPMKRTLVTSWKVDSGIMYPYNSDKTNALKLEISRKIDVYSYRRAHKHASCSAGVICRGCGVVTCNMQPSIYWKHLGHPWIAGILYSTHIVALDLFFCHSRRHSYLSGIRLLQLCPVIQRSVNKVDHCMYLLQWLGKKIKLEE